MGRERFEHWLKLRPAKKLGDGDHLLFHHALRCICQRCGRLLDWECPEDVSNIITECCGISYRLVPWTVKVEVEDLSSRPILPKMEGSDYADPDTDLSQRLIGEPRAIESKITGGLSEAQKALARPSRPAGHLSEPRTYTLPAKKPIPPQTLNRKQVRRCSTCREIGHDRRKCPTN